MLIMEALMTAQSVVGAALFSYPRPGKGTLPPMYGVEVMPNAVPMKCFIF